MEIEYENYAGKVNSMIYLAGAVAAFLGSIIVHFTFYRVVILLSIIPKIFEVIISFKLENIENNNSTKKYLSR